MIGVTTILWLAIAVTPSGVVVGHFTDKYECGVAVGYARMQGYAVVDCFKVRVPPAHPAKQTGR